MPDALPKRLIEVDFPMKKVSEQARREKSIRHGHISTLHVWWARRPLASCRAIILASLLPDPSDNACPQLFRNAALKALEPLPGRMRPGDDRLGLRQAILDFIANFSDWDRAADPLYLKAARELVAAAYPERRPMIADPFAGGGAIPLEALRVGGDAWAGDLNPVAVLLEKVVLEYVPRYGQRLADGVTKWGKWITDQAGAELAPFYPRDPNGQIPNTYLWARTVRCEGPSCGVEIPLVHSLLLGRHDDDYIALALRCNDRRSIGIEIVRVSKPEEIGAGTVRRGAAVCPCCDYTTPAPNVRKQLVARHGGADEARLLAVVCHTPGHHGRHFRLGQAYDHRVAALSQAELLKRGRDHRGSLTLLPEEELPYLRSIFNINLLGVNRWRYLFTSRQLLAQTTLWRLLRARVEAEASNDEQGLVQAIAACVAMAIDRLSAQNSTLSWWQPKGEFVVGTFGRQALGIIWDFAEVRPIGGASGDLEGALDWVTRVIEHLARANYTVGDAQLVSATELPLPNASVDIYFTDPPYYDAVPYADLSDFFYVQLRRMLAKVFPSSSPTR